jgi:signal transduction histidine kinase
MSTSKRSATGATNLNTGTFTSPIIVKILLAFAVMTLLGVIISLFALFNISHSNDNLSEALELQQAVNRVQQVRALLTEQQQQAEQVLFQGQNSERFNQLRDTLSYRYFYDVVQHTFDLDQLFNQEKAFLTLFDQSLQQPKEARLKDEPNIRGQLSNFTNQMLQTVQTLDTTFSELGRNKLEEMSKNQQDAFSTTLVLSLLALLIMIGLIWFVLAKVIQPLNQMNVQLSQLLWSQNEHLTEQLNILQQEINTNNVMMTTVRHDLKAPLSNMKSLAELSLITRPDLPTDIEQNLQKIIEVSDKSVDTISNLLARREVALNVQPVSLPELIDKVLQLVDLRWFNITRKVDATEAVIDPGLMEHALLNLVSNARKFSGGGIGIGANLVRKAGTVDEEELELWVWNDGAVISAGDREEIFKPGKQLEAGKKAGGHGLGLAIVKSIAERHHGRVTVESHEKKGTTFRIIVPLIKVEEAQPSPTVIPAEPIARLVNS